MALLAAVVLDLPMVGCAEPAGTEAIIQRVALRGARPSDAWRNVVRLDDTCTGVLVHSHVVAYAAHCGERKEASNGVDSVALHRCTPHPDWSSSGLDLAICELERALRGSIVVPVIARCERECVGIGTRVSLASYGAIAEDGGLGELRAADATITSTSERELTIHSDDVGACNGDSGSPAHVALPDSGLRAWRVLAVLSNSSPGCAVDELLHYTPVEPLMDWMQSVSGLDVSPCTDGRGEWAPTLGCVSFVSDEPDIADALPSGTCGAPRAVPETDTRPPSVTLSVKSEDGSERVVVEAEDEGSGVRWVTIHVVHGPDEVVWAKTLDAPPYEIEVPSLTAGVYDVRAAAGDFAGHEGMDSVTYVTPLARAAASSDCSVVLPGQRTEPCLLWLSLAGMLLRIRQTSCLRALQNASQHRATKRESLYFASRREVNDALVCIPP